MAYYKKALELDPDNETYKSNLKIAELKLKETPSPVSPPGSKGCDSVREAEHRQAEQTLSLLTSELGLTCVQRRCVLLGTWSLFTWV